MVSIDGEKDGVQAIIDGKLGCSCECNPRFGPAGFDILYNYAKGEKIPPMIINPDRFFDATQRQGSPYRTRSERRKSLDRKGSSRLASRRREDAFLSSALQQLRA